MSMGKFNGNHFNFSSKKFIPLKDAKALLTDVDGSRRWEEVKASDLDIRGGIVKAKKQKKGLLTPFAFQQLRRLVEARPGQLEADGVFDDCVGSDENGNKRVDRELMYTKHLKVVTDRLKKLDKPVHLRIQKKENGFNTVLSALTSRYEAIPYAGILDAFPESFGTPRLAVDDRYVSIHVIEPKPFMSEGGGLFMGARVKSSDIGAARLSLSLQVFRIVCTNGMVVTQDLFAVNKIHLTGIREEWSKIVEEWRKGTPKFKTDIKRVIEKSRRDKMTAEQAIDELLDLRLPRRRIERALEIAESEFGGVTRWSVANGVTQASQEIMAVSPIKRTTPAIATADAYDVAAANFLRRAA